MNTSGPVNARFYSGDPDNGGTLIESNDGKTIFSTDDLIAARENKIINFDWTLPDDTPYFPRIYVILDPDNAIDEIHENNNKGWKVLNYNDGTTGTDDGVKTIYSFRLDYNFPNPFNPVTTIKYSLPQELNIKLIVYDILGREIVTLINEEKPAGEYEIRFDAAAFPSGVYFYRITAGNFSQTKKMLLLK